MQNIGNILAGETLKGVCETKQQGKTTSITLHLKDGTMVVIGGTDGRVLPVKVIPAGTKKEKKSWQS